jgi:acyl-CoA synthetase (AMP-forming)/AMP-acid ligase II
MSLVQPGAALGQQAFAQRWRDEGRWLDRTISDDIRRGIDARGDVPVVFHSDVRPSTTTLRELHDRAQRVAAGLQRLGVRPGDAVALQLPNWAEGVVAHLSAWMCGALLVPIVPIYGPREISFILRQSRARVFVVARHLRTRDAADTIAGLGHLPDLQSVVVVGEPLADTEPWDALEATAAPPRPVAGDPDDVCLLVYTSGTTADPKGVQHSHNTLLAEVHARDAFERDVSGIVHLAAFPLGHIAGALGLLRMFVHGVRTIAMDAWDPVAAARLVEEHRVSSGVGAPIYLSTLLDEAERQGRDVSSLTEYMTGAANVSPALVERADAVGIRAYRCYGSSEHPTISSGEPEDPLVKRATTDGRVTPGNEWRLLDDDDRDVPTGVDGEIVTRGPEQFLGYLDPALNEGLYVDGGWLRTGDVGRVDADGFLTITDRKKDIIIRGGENIASKEVEDVLLTHPAVADVAAVGAPDERYGERVCAFVVLRPGASLTMPDVQQHFAAAGLARQKTPERLELVDVLPRTAAGKIQKFALREQLRG